MGLSLLLGIFCSSSSADSASTWLGAWFLVRIEFFLDFRLATGQFLITLLVLEGRADFGLQFLRPLLESLMSDSSRAARSSNPCTIDSSERMVPSAVSVTRAL